MEEVKQQEVDPLEIELKSKDKTGNTDPLDIHAQYFYMYFPRFRNGLQNMNKKALIRLISSLVECPLNEKDIKIRSEMERNLFHMGDQLLCSKYLMMLVTHKRVEDEKNKIDKPDDVVVESNEIKEGVING